MTKTKIRKKPVALPSLVDAELPKKLEAVGLYALGTPIEEIAERLGWDPKSVYTTIEHQFRDLKEVMETEAFVKAEAADAGGLSKKVQAVQLYRSQEKLDKDINSKFIAKLSPPEDEIITQEETLFCYLMVHEGDEVKALEDSGLAEGLTKSSKTYKRAIKLRILMLKGKKNLIRYINGLQIDYAKEMNVNKEMIQSELISQIRELRALKDPRLAPTIAKLTQDLGRTTGAFSDKLIVEEVSFDDAMDEMENRRKQRDLELGKDTQGAYVYDPEKIG